MLRNVRAHRSVRRGCYRCVFCFLLFLCFYDFCKGRRQVCARFSNPIFLFFPHKTRLFFIKSKVWLSGSNDESLVWSHTHNTVSPIKNFDFCWHPRDSHAM
jgi:hypothetical protein